MGIFDKAKDVLSSHPDQVDQGLEQAAEYVDERTGKKYTERIDQGEHLAKDRIDDYLGEDKPAAPAPPEPPA